MLCNESLHLGGDEAVSYKVAPVVILSILDHYKRRQDGMDRVVGTLLGVKHGNQVQIEDCFPVPFHVENTDRATIGKDYHDNMLALHSQVNPGHEVVGWYSTGDKITYISSLMHNHYYTECANPVMLTVDVGLTNSRMAVRAYTSVTVTRQDPDVINKYQACANVKNVGDNQNVVARFESAPLEYFATEADMVGVDAMINGTPEESDSKGLDAPATFLGDLDSLESSLTKLSDSVHAIQSYVQKVQSGEIKGDPVLGRKIANVMSAVPYFSPSVFNDNVQDLLMIVYLAKITRTQVALSASIHSLS